MPDVTARTIGRMILRRRFNRDDWATDRFGGRLWSEQLPDNERIAVNGEQYTHWCDCMTDYFLYYANSLHI